MESIVGLNSERPVESGPGWIITQEVQTSQALAEIAGNDVGCQGRNEQIPESVI